MLASLLHRFVGWLDETWAWHWFARNVLAAHLTVRFSGYPAFDFSRYEELLDVLSKARADQGAVYAWVSCDRKSLASILIRAVSKSRWSHAGWMLLGSENGLDRAVHMMGNGMNVDPLLRVLRESDDFALVRFPTPWRKLIEARIREYANSSPGRVRYDFEQELSSEASPVEADDIYCSELIWMCGRPELLLQPSRVLGRLCFSPDDVAANGEIVWQHVSSNKSSHPTIRSAS